MEDPRAGVVSVAVYMVEPPNSAIDRDDAHKRIVTSSNGSAVELPIDTTSRTIGSTKL